MKQDVWSALIRSSLESNWSTSKPLGCRNTCVIATANHQTKLNQPNKGNCSVKNWWKTQSSAKFGWVLHPLPLLHISYLESFRWPWDVHFQVRRSPYVLSKQPAYLLVSLQPCTWGFLDTTFSTNTDYMVWNHRMVVSASEKKGKNQIWGRNSIDGKQRRKLYSSMMKDFLLTPNRKAVPFSRQSLESSLAARMASDVLIPPATTAQTRAPADDPAKGVFSWKKKRRIAYFLSVRISSWLIRSWKKIETSAACGEKQQKSLTVLISSFFLETEIGSYQYYEETYKFEEEHTLLYIPSSSHVQSNTRTPRGDKETTDQPLKNWNRDSSAMAFVPQPSHLSPVVPKAVRD